MKKLTFLKNIATLFTLIFFIYEGGGNLLMANTNPDSLEVIVLDRFGNQLTTKDKTAMNLNRDGEELCTCGDLDPAIDTDFFEIVFENDPDIVGFDVNPDMMITICQVFRDLAVLIQQQNPNPCNLDPVPEPENVIIRIKEILKADLGSGIVLANASSRYIVPAIADEAVHTGIIDGEVWNVINRGQASQLFQLSSETSHGYVNVNFHSSINWFADTDFNVGSNNAPNTVEHDLYSVILHEAIHALGFASLISETGGSKFAINVNGIDIPNSYYSRYDVFLKDDLGDNLIDNSGGNVYDWIFNSDLSKLTSGCSPTVNTASIYNMSLTNNEPVYAPDPYKVGSSISHLHINCGGTTPEYVMNPGLPNGTMRRAITQEEVNILCSLGYNISDHYGEVGTENEITVTGCGSNLPIGIDDFSECCSNDVLFISRCQDQDHTIELSGLIECNDINTNSYDGLEVLFPAAGVSLSGTSLTLDVLNIPENYILLRYIPVNGSDFGNITYIYVHINPCLNIEDLNIPPCTPDANSCNLICNPTIQVIPGCWGVTENSGTNGVWYQCVPGWGSLHGTPDFRIDNFGQPAGENLLQNANGNTTDVPEWRESVVTPVNIIAGNRYILSFILIGNPMVNNIIIDDFVCRLTSEEAIVTGLQNDELFPGGGGEPIGDPIAPNELPNHVPLFQEVFNLNETGSQVNNTTFSQVVSCFVAEDNWEYLYLQQNTIDELANEQPLFGHIVLVEDQEYSDQTIDVSCKEQVVLTNLFAGSCPDLDNDVLYSWIDQDGNILEQNTLEYTFYNSLPGNVTITLRREFLAGDYPLIESNSEQCNNEIQFNITVSDDCCPDETDFSITPPPPVICESDADFFIQTTGFGSFTNSPLIIVEKENKTTAPTSIGLSTGDPITPGEGFFTTGFTYTIYYHYFGGQNCEDIIGPSYTFEIVPDECCEELTCCTDEVANTYLPPPDFSSINEPKIGWSYDSNPWNISSGPIRLNNIFYIPTDKHLYINNMNFEMGPNAKIVIAPGALLDLNGCIITGDPICETMWHGIRVLGPGVGVTADATNAGQLFMDGGRIEDAVIGGAATQIYSFFTTLEDVFNDVVSHLGSCATPLQNIFSSTLPNDGIKKQNLSNVFTGTLARQNAGGRIELNNHPVFHNCFQGINLSWHQSFNGFTSKIEGASFTSNSIASGNTLRYPFDNLSQTNSGITAIENQGLEIKNCSFENLSNGVYLIDGTHQNVHHNTVTSCLAGISLVSYKDNTCYTPTTTARNYINNNTISDFDNGIELYNHEAIIQDNFIFNPSIELLLQQTGIAVGGSKFDIVNNKVKSCAFGIFLIDNDAVSSSNNNNWIINERDFNSDGMSSYLYNNKIRDIVNGLHIVNDNTAIQTACNQFSNYWHSGINLFATEEINVLANQGDCNDDLGPPGNVFVPNPMSSNFYAIVSENNKVLPFKYFVVDPNSNPEGNGDIPFQNITCNNDDIVKINPCTNNPGPSYCGQNEIEIF